MNFSESLNYLLLYFIQQWYYDLIQFLATLHYRIHLTYAPLQNHACRGEAIL